MYSHILLPTDGSDRSIRSIEAGIQLAKALNARVTGLFVSAATYIDTVDAVLEPNAKEALLTLARSAEELGLECDCISLRSDSPHDGIVHIANDKGCDLIIMATHGRSKVGKFFLGSVAASVLADCDIPVLLYR